MVRPSCPRFCACPPNVVRPSPRASTPVRGPTRSTPICNAPSPSGWRNCCHRSGNLARWNSVAAPACSAGICSRAIPAGHSSSPTSPPPWSSNAGALSTLRTLLAPNGTLIYATISAKSFPEWRDVLAAHGLPVGLLDIPELPGIVDEERIVADADTLAFLRRMKAIGGLTPREGYAPMPAGALRRAIRAVDGKHGGRITWHIVYGGVVASQ